MHDYQSLGHMIIQELINIRTDFRSEIQKLGDRLEKCLNLQATSKNENMLTNVDATTKNIYAAFSKENTLVSSSNISCTSDANFGVADLCQTESAISPASTHTNEENVAALVSNVGQETPNITMNPLNASLFIQNEVLNSVLKEENVQDNFLMPSVLKNAEPITQDKEVSKSWNITDIVSTNAAFDQIKNDDVENTTKKLSSGTKVGLNSSGKPMTQCNICEKLVRTDYFNYHLANHSGIKPHTCNICGKSFSFRTNMVKHMCLHTGIFPFACQKCGKKFVRRDRFNQHMIKVHRLNVISDCLDVADAVSASDKIENNNFQKLTHSRKFEMNRNNSRKLKTQCNVCGKFLRTDYLHNHLANHSGIKPHTCTICGKSFSFRTNMLQHMCLHTGIFPFSCKKCGKKFTRKDRFNKHNLKHSHSNKTDGEGN